MDLSNWYPAIWISLMFVWMNIIVPFFPLEYRMIGGMGGLIICVVGMVMLEQMLKWTAASFMYLEMICRPSNQKLHAFVKNFETREIAENIFCTKFNLGEKVKHILYDVLENLVIIHELNFETRFRLKPGKATYKGQIVDHPKTARIIVYEPVEGSFDVDHLSPIPTFWLKDAPGDYYLPRGALGSGIMFNGGQFQALTFDVSQVRMENDALRSQNVELKRQGLDWHQKAVKLEEVVEGLKNELLGVLDSKGDFKKSVVEFMLTIREQQLRIEHALKGQIGLKLTITKVVAILLLVGGFLGAVVFDVGGFRQWLGLAQNQFFLAIIAIATVLIYIYTSKKAK